MRKEWIAMEHYRMHSVEDWPDGPKKDAALAAIRSSLASLSQISGLSPSCGCMICRSREREAGVLEFPARRVAA